MKAYSMPLSKRYACDPITRSKHDRQKFIEKQSVPIFDDLSVYFPTRHVREQYHPYRLHHPPPTHVQHPIQADALSRPPPIHPPNLMPIHPPIRQLLSVNNGNPTKNTQFSVNEVVQVPSVVYEQQHTSLGNIPPVATLHMQSMTVSAIQKTVKVPNAGHKQQLRVGHTSFGNTLPATTRNIQPMTTNAIQKQLQVPNAGWEQQLRVRHTSLNNSLPATTQNIQPMTTNAIQKQIQVPNTGCEQQLWVGHNSLNDILPATTWNIQPMTTNTIQKQIQVPNAGCEQQLTVEHTSLNNIPPMAYMNIQPMTTSAIQKQVHVSSAGCKQQLIVEHTSLNNISPTATMNIQPMTTNAIQKQVHVSSAGCKQQLIVEHTSLNNISPVATLNTQPTTPSAIQKQVHVSSAGCKQQLIVEHTSLNNISPMVTLNTQPTTPGAIQEHTIIGALDHPDAQLTKIHPHQKPIPVKQIDDKQMQDVETSPTSEPSLLAALQKIKTQPSEAYVDSEKTIKDILLNVQETHQSVLSSRSSINWLKVYNLNSDSGIGTESGNNNTASNTDIISNNSTGSNKSISSISSDNKDDSDDISTTTSSTHNSKMLIKSENCNSSLLGKCSTVNNSSDNANNKMNHSIHYHKDAKNNVGDKENDYAAHPVENTIENSSDKNGTSTDCGGISNNNISLSNSSGKEEQKVDKNKSKLFVKLPFKRKEPAGNNSLLFMDEIEQHKKRKRSHNDIDINNNNNNSNNSSNSSNNNNKDPKKSISRDIGDNHSTNSINDVNKNSINDSSNKRNKNKSSVIIIEDDDNEQTNITIKKEEEVVDNLLDNLEDYQDRVYSKTVDNWCSKLLQYRIPYQDPKKWTFHLDNFKNKMVANRKNMSKEYLEILCDEFFLSVGVDGWIGVFNGDYALYQKGKRKIVIPGDEFKAMEKHIRLKLNDSDKEFSNIFDDILPRIKEEKDH